MTFQQFNSKLSEQFTAMQKFKLFRLNITGQEIWDAYLDGFEPEEDPIFRDPESSTHNCNNDKHFIRRYGNIVAIDNDFNVVTMFDIDVTGTIYENTVNNIKKLLSTGKVVDIFVETYDELHNLPYEACKKSQDVFQLGHVKTLKRYTQEEADKFGVVNVNDIYEFHHFHAFLSSAFVDTSGKSVESIMGQVRDCKNVFERGITEIPLDTLLLVKDLIVQGSLLNGDAHLYKIEEFSNLKKEFDTIDILKRNNWCWVKSYNLPIAKFRNELIGTLCVDLAEGQELNTACQTWNKRVDPANYMKAKAPITKRQIEEAQKFVEENGYVESFNRRFATLSDIDVSEIKHMNVSTNEIKEAGLFSGVTPTVSTRHKKSQFDGIEEVSIEKFMTSILPSCTSIEAFVENRFENNLVCLTTANVKDSKPIFKWNNNYSWTYNGNLTGKSQIREAVKAAGGNVDGILTCRLAWNDEKQNDGSDLDLWCVQPNKEKIGFNTGFRKDSGNRFSSCGGQLDVDDRGYSSNIHVENIYFKDQSRLKDGEYKFYVHQYSSRNSKGFKAEIEVAGNTYSYQYNNPVKGSINLATVKVKNGQFDVVHELPETTSTKTIWGIDTNQFHKVNLVCLSPNHWGTNNIGNKHYFFMIDDCKSDVPMRSFHNENLIGDLLEHRKVMEVLADTTRLQPAKEQLAGLGFNATVNDHVILKLKGSFQRTIKINF